MLKKTKILIMSLCLGVMPYTVSNAMEKKPIVKEQVISSKGVMSDTVSNAMEKKMAFKEQIITTKDVDFYLKAVEIKRQELKEKYEIFMRCSLQKSKEKISPFFLDLIAYTFTYVLNGVDSSCISGKIDLEKILEYLGKRKKLEPGVTNFKFDENAKKELQKVVKSFCDEFRTRFGNFKEVYGQENFTKLLNKMNEFFDMYNKPENGDSSCVRKKILKKAYEDRISEYVDDLGKIFENFQKEWECLLEEYSNTKHLEFEDIARFVVSHHKIMSKIFLDEKDDVNLDEFLEEIQKEDRLKSDVDMKYINDKELKDILKKAFVKYKNGVNEKLDQFYKQHEEYKELLSDKITEEIPTFSNWADVVNYAMEVNNDSEENSTVCSNEEFTEENSTIYSNEGTTEENIINEASEENINNESFKKRIIEYVRNLSEDFDEFETEWDKLLVEYSFKELSNSDLEKFAAIYNLAMSRIFLDENNDVKVDEFLRKLEKQNGEKYRHELTENQKYLLKNAFVKYKEFVGRELEKFYKKHKNYKDQLNKKLDRKIIVFDDVEELKEYLSKNSFPIENYSDFFKSEFSEI